MKRRKKIPGRAKLRQIPADNKRKNMKTLSPAVKKYFKNKTVFLTGASSGIGKSIALDLGKCGARIGLVARRKQMLDDVAEQIKKAGSEVLALAVDVADKEQIKKAADNIKQEFGPVDVLIANAGMGGTMTADNFSSEIFENVFNVNFMGVIYCIEAVLPEMLKRKSGHIAAVSSLAAWRGLPMHGAYSASKSALTTALESLRNELRPRGVSVTTISPGFVRTEMTDKDGGAKLPFLIEADDAACRILSGMAKKQRDIAFPFPTASAMRLAKLLPDAVWDAVAMRVVSMDPREK